MRMNKAPMGWNSYDYYDTNVNEAQVKANADYMAKHLLPYGWEYIVVDIEWYAWHTGSQRDKYQYIPFGKVEMDDYGRLFPCPEKFPSSANGAGFRPLADYVHAKGLKFGIHIMRGIPREAAQRHLPIMPEAGTEDVLYNACDVADPSSICKWNPDMYGVRAGVPGAQEYYDSVIRLYAEWGVDFIKCDDICNTNMYVDNPYSAAHEIEMLHRAIEKCGRDIVLSLSPGPALIEKAWHYEKNANMWRITDDFWDEWELLRQMFWRCELWQNHVTPGNYPDCDMLPIGTLGQGFGNGPWQTRFTRAEQRTMMTLWCIFGSPLMIGAELTLLDDWTLSLLQNKEVLKLLENDYIGRQVERDDAHAIWSCANDKTGERFVALFNLSDQTEELQVDLAQVEQFLSDPKAVDTATELWSGEKATVESNVLSVSVESHDAKLFALKNK